MLFAVILVLLKAMVNILGGENITIPLQIAKPMLPQRSSWQDT